MWNQLIKVRLLVGDVDSKLISVNPGQIKPPPLRMMALYHHIHQMREMLLCQQPIHLALAASVLITPAF